MSLPDATAAMTAIGNDYSYAEVFTRQVLAAGRPGDVAVGLTTSGNSDNVVQALEAAGKAGMATVALTGARGGKAAEGRDPAGTDDRHRPGTGGVRASGHVICEMVEAALFPGHDGTGLWGDSSESGVTRVAAVLLDRDGTVNVKATEGQYVTSPATWFCFLAPRGPLRAQRSFGSGHPGDQPEMAVTMTDLTPYARVHARLEELLAEEGARLDAAYYCPHAAGACHCRKPAPDCWSGRRRSTF